MLFSAAFALLAGALMIGFWLFFLAKDMVPELATEPIRIRFHIAGEFITAIALLIGGVGLLAGLSWSPWFTIFALGMLLYTVIVSPGYYAQQGKWSMVGLFAILFVLALVSVALLI